MLVRSCILLLLLTVLLIISLCYAWECFDNRSGHVAGLADGQGIAAVLDRLELQCELELKGL